MERVKGIEPSYAAWEAAVLPLNYARAGALDSIRLHRRESNAAGVIYLSKAKIKRSMLLGDTESWVTDANSIEKCSRQRSAERYR